MAIATYPSEFSVEPIFTLSIENEDSLVTLPAPLPPGNYQMDTAYKSGTLYLNFLDSDAPTANIVGQVTLVATSFQSIFFTLTGQASHVVLRAPTSALDSIISVLRLKRGIETPGDWDAELNWYEVPMPASFYNYDHSEICFECTSNGVYLIGAYNASIGWNSTPNDGSGGIWKWDGTPTGSFAQISNGAASMYGGATYSQKVGTDIYFTTAYSTVFVRLYKLDTSTDTVTAMAAFPSGYAGNLGGLIYNPTTGRLYKFASWNDTYPRGVSYFDVSTGTHTIVGSTANPATNAYGSNHIQTSDPDIIAIKTAGGSHLFSASAATFTAATISLPNAYENQMTPTPSGSVHLVPALNDSTNLIWNLQEHRLVGASAVTATTVTDPPYALSSYPSNVAGGTNNTGAGIDTNVLVLYMNDKWTESAYDRRVIALPASLAFSYYQ